jgi:hypothetical protein
VHHSFSKLKRILTLMIIKSKALEVGKKSFKNTFEHICFKHAFDLDFENVFLTKFIHFYVI